PLLEGACFANLMWNDASSMRVARKLIRTFTSWMLAMQRGPDDSALALLSRASYPVSVDAHDDGRTFHIDYELVRPGLDNDATEFVHVPQNPEWGDVW